MNKARGILGFLVAAALSVGTADAQPAPALKPEDSTEARAARSHYDLGTEFYTAKNYEAARLEFETAYRLYPAPDFLFNLARCAEKQGRTKDAIDYLERYVQGKRDTAGSEADAEVRALLDQLRSQSTGPAPGPSSAPAPRTDPPRPVERGQRPSGLSIGLMAGGGAVLLSGIGCGAAALALGLDVRDRAAQPWEELAPDFDRGRALDGATIGLSVAGGLAIGAGVALWIVDRVRARRAPIALRPAAPLLQAR
jgi:tetratricopeptide (TPR) repeat protein